MQRRRLLAVPLMITGPFLAGASCHPWLGWALPFVIVILAVAWLTFMLGPGRSSRPRDNQERRPGQPHGRKGTGHRSR